VRPRDPRHCRRQRPRPDAENFGGEVSFEPPFTSLDQPRRPAPESLETLYAFARVRASWGLSGFRGNFCREAPGGLSLAQFQPSPCHAGKSQNSGRSAKRLVWSRTRIGKAASSRSRSGRTFLNLRDPSFPLQTLRPHDARTRARTHEREGYHLPHASYLLLPPAIGAAARSPPPNPQNNRGTSQGDDRG